MTDPQSKPDSSRALIVQLQHKLISLGRDVGDLPPKDIEAAAKSINALIGSLEKAETYLSRHRPPPVGAGLSKASRRDLLQKIKRMVENGILRELDDE